MRNHQCRYPCCRWSSLLDACCYSGITCASMLCIPGIFRPTATKFSVHWRHHRAHRRLSVCLPFCAVDCCDHMVTSNFTWKKPRYVWMQNVKKSHCFIQRSWTRQTLYFLFDVRHHPLCSAQTERRRSTHKQLSRSNRSCFWGFHGQARSQ